MIFYLQLFALTFAAALAILACCGYQIGTLAIIILWFLIVLTIGLSLDASDHRGIAKEKRRTPQGSQKAIR